MLFLGFCRIKGEDKDDARRPGVLRRGTRLRNRKAGAAGFAGIINNSIHLRLTVERAAVT